MKLKPQAQAVIDELEALGAKPIESLRPEEAREQPTPKDAVHSLLRSRGESAEPEEVGGVEDRTIPGPGGEIPIRVYRPRSAEGTLDRIRDALSPDDSALPVLVYVHGGGWVIADLDVYDASPRALTNRANCIVVSVEYRHAPEHPFPASHEDVLAATRWVMQNAGDLGGDPNRVAIGGESAGGNMATATCIELKRAGERLPVFQVLVYPVTDFVGQDYASYEDSADAKPLNVPMLEWFGQHEMTDPGQAEDVRLSPLRASVEELSGLPPALVITAESDPLRDQGEDYAHKLMDAGVHVSLTRFPGVMHEFFGMTAVLDSAKLAVQQAALALQAGFEGIEPAASDRD